MATTRSNANKAKIDIVTPWKERREFVSFMHKMSNRFRTSSKTLLC